MFPLDGGILGAKQSHRPGEGRPQCGLGILEGFNLYCDLRALGEDLAGPKSFLKRCDHHTEIELCELMEECKDDLQEVAEFLSNLSPQRRNSAIRSDRDLQGFHKKICDRTESLREFLAQATFAGLENMKAQLFMLVEDISSARRPPYVLRKIVDWDALADELGQPASADPKALMLEEGDSNASHGGFIELPDPSAANSHSASPQRPHTEVSNSSKKARYRQPTVEDWVEGDDGELPLPTILPMSPRSHDGAVNPHSHESNPKSSQDETPTIQRRAEEDPMADSSRKPRRVDTETRLMQQEKLTMKEEIRKLKEEAERYEELKLVAEL
ncbi:hypothetical protein MPH_09878 [Macrophomina phaseolina MS6]|uniref:Uncharacterized protein n=1 Tax=Macrophomina phaseolina (strain MS6) TaxID=1126212 RepID=K2S7W9_MACPH|nr:hypothetical protein MPH_09878 [Macrophomina phaseolina MS6]